MQISELFIDLGQDGFNQLIRGISIGKLKTYQLYDALKARTRIPKLNVEGLRKATGRLWERVSGKDDDLSKDLAQAVLLSNLDMIIAILDFLGIPHQNGFFANDIDTKPYFTEGWPERVLEHFKGKYSDPILRFYVAHLAWESSNTEREGTAALPK